LPLSGAAFLSGELIEKGRQPVNRAWIGWNEDAAGWLAHGGERILANSAIHTIYNTKIV
jgi:hypothetical protein